VSTSRLGSNPVGSAGSVRNGVGNESATATGFDAGGRERAPTGGDPLVAVLSGYDVHVPQCVLGKVTDASGGDDLLAVAADVVLKASHHLTAHDVRDSLDQPLDCGLDEQESLGIQLANELDAGLFVTDEFKTVNYLLVALALDDRNTLFTTPPVLCRLATAGVLDPSYVTALLSYYVETKGWDAEHVGRLRRAPLEG
jgi:hypothetical protein